MFLALLVPALVALRLYAQAANPPNAPVNTSPANGATGVSSNPMLCASASDPDGGALSVTFKGREVATGPSPEFTLIALPDTQFYAQSYPQIFNSQTQWIVDNIAARNIAFVTHLGDCTNNGDDQLSQWTNANAAFTLLENYLTPAFPNGMPYGIAVGNHDQTPIGTARSAAGEGGTTRLYNQTFGVSRFLGRGYYGGHYDANNDNHFELFSAGGMDFINIALEYDATASPERTAVLDWADSILKTHPDRRAIITSHYLLNPNATFSNQGQATYDALKDNPNLFLMLCGHLDQAARRTDVFSGSTVHTVLSDYQTQPSGGNGWLRILTFSPDNDTISVQTYSPFLSQNLTDSLNQFALAYDMQGGLPFQTIGAASGVPSGGTACAPWPGRKAGKQYEWFATASDGTSQTSGAHSTFTSGGSCAVPADCDDGNACTADACDAGQCAHSQIANCCNQSSDCNDGNACSADTCGSTNAAALAFNGASDYATMGVATELNAAQFTIEFWMKRTGVGTTANTGTGGFLGIPLVTKGVAQADDHDNKDMNYFVGINDSLGGVIGADFEEGAGGTSPSLNHPVFGATPVPSDVWTHVAVTYDGTWRLYLNGNSDGTLLVGQPPRSDSIQHFALGTAIDTTGLTSGRYQGQLDEVRVWKRALSQAEILAGMSSQNVSGPDLVGHFSLNEGTGTVAGDSALPAQNGTVVGATWVTGDLADIGPGVCAATPIAGCCATAADCGDDNACTQDACDAGLCAHLYSPTPSCCVTAADCDDSNQCTDDSCGNGACANAPNFTCCLSNTDCNDGNACSTDLCSQPDGAALSFNGSTGQVTMGPAPGLGTATFTIETWFRWNGGGATANTGTGGITAYPLVSKGLHEVENSNRDMNYFLGIDSATSKLAADFEEGATGTTPGLNHPVLGMTVVTTGVWHHAAVTYNGTCWQLYLDGLAETGGTNCPGQPPRADSIQHFGLATAIDSTGLAEGHFNGTLDEVRLWGQARTEQQIRLAMNAAITSAPGLIARWGLDEGTGNTAGNSTGDQNSGTISGGTTWVTTGLPPLAASQCASIPNPGCCLTNAECNDGLACTADVCLGNACQHSAIAGCCTTSADCNDGNTCTADACQNNICTHLNTCCSTGADCNDDNTCTADSCVVGSGNPAALQFNGTSGFVTMGNTSALGFATFTLEAWIKRDTGGVGASTGTGGLTSALPLVDKGAAQAEASNVDMNYILAIDSVSGRLAADFEEGATGASPGLNHPVVATTVVSTGVWHHAAVTYDGTCWTIYLDGTSEAFTSGTACPARPPRSDSIQHFGLGTSLNSTGVAAGFYKGAMDEVRVWNRALTQAEIQANMNTQVPANISGLIGHWLLNEGTGTSVGDSALPAQNGTMNAGVTWITTGLADLGPKQCSFTPVAGGTLCSDGNSCTQTDTCQAGVCSGTNTVTCALPDQCHDAGTCDQATGLCSNPAKTNGTACNDGNACTLTDSCQAGVCTGTSTVTCALPDQCHDAGTCDQATGLCSNPAKTNGAACSDGNACTQTDSCQAGFCTGSNTVTCALPDQCHDAGTCDQATGLCSNPAKTNGTACSDGNACTQTDICTNGVCVAGAAPDCNDNNPCTDDSCDPTAGCLHTNNTATCDDGNVCNGTGVCQNGTCAGTPPPDCDDGNLCTTDSCDPILGCAHVNNTLACDDGNACTQTDSCQAGVCTGTNTVTCTAVDQCHDAGTCNQATGLCSNPAKMDGAACSDGNACTQTDSCQAGVCTGTGTVTCMAADQCHDAGTCNQATGLCSNPAKTNGAACSDGNACTQTDSCQAGVCTGTNAVTCALPDQCHDAGTCDQATGLCSNPAKTNGTPCSDGNACTAGDTCIGGACTPGSTSPEVCNGVDDNCNGSIDEGNPGGGVACSTGLPGACMAGTTVCSGGTIVCVGNTTPATANVLVQLNSAMKYRANSATTVADDAVLVQINSPMRYLANTANPGIGLTWVNEAFNDSAWSAGTYGVGYDTAAAPNALSLIKTSVSPGTFSVFTRAAFSIADVAAVKNLYIGADYDDGFVAYLNGIEVARSSTMPAGDPAWNTDAALHESSNAAVPNYGTLIDLSSQIGLLHNGPNVLAIGVWNSAAATSTDLVVVPKLSVGLEWTGKSYDDSAWTAGTYGVGYDTGAAPNALSLIKTSVPDGTLSVFTRAHFNVPSAAALAAIRTVLLGVDYDDGVVAWVNGVEVLGSAEMPFGALTPTTVAALHESSNAAVPNYSPLIDVTARALPILVVGDNVLAIGVWNNASSSTDLVLVPRLSLGEAETCDGLDNDCNGIVDDGFRDSDSDGQADCVDPDDDNDGAADALDCEPLDPLASSPPPAEVSGLLWLRAPDRAFIPSWTGQGEGLRYDLAGGLVSQLRIDAGTQNATCVPGGNDLSNASFVGTLPDPPPGQVYYYIVRSQSSFCGSGTYGHASSGAERLPTSACP